MEDDAWVELDWDASTALWVEFADLIQLRAGVTTDDWPAIVEPSPSVVWSLGPVFTGDYPGGFAAGCRDVSALVLGTLQDCAEWYETVVFHDWIHPSCLFRPHKVHGPEEVPGWDVGGLLPNGDYTIFVGREHAFGAQGASCIGIPIIALANSPANVPIFTEVRADAINTSLSDLLERP